GGVRTLRRRCWRGRRGGDGADVVGRIRGDADHVPYRHLTSLTYHDLAEDTGAEGFDLHVGPVRLDLRDDLAAPSGLPLLLEPLDDLAGLHRFAELGHEDLGDHAQTSRIAAAILSFEGVFRSSRLRA